jgi:Ca2+-transporting ATPase
VKIYPNVEPVLEELGTDPEHGLTSEQVCRNRERYGSNELSPPEKDPLWKQFLEGFKDPTIIILCICAVLAIGIGVYRDEIPFDGVAILIAVLIATGVGFWSEYKADQAFELLKKDVQDVPVKVTRNGDFHTISIHELVMGDIIHLEGGDKVPADCKLIESVDLIVDESLMTGESVPVNKGREDVNLIGGTVVTVGSGRAVVTAIGDKMEMGAILKALGEKEEEETPLQQKLGVLANQISAAGTAAAVLIFLSLFAAGIFTGTFGEMEGTIRFPLMYTILGLAVLGGLLMIVKSQRLRRVITFAVPGLITALLVAADVFFTRGPEAGFTLLSLQLILDYFVVAVTIIVVAVPEGLPMAVVISLALSMRKIRQDNNLVRKMVATETVGSANVICSDKTGTLTENQMAVAALYLHGQLIEGETVYTLQSHPAFDILAFGAAVNSTAHLEHEDGRVKFVGNTTEATLLAWLERQGVDYRHLRRQSPVYDRVCFTSERKMMTTHSARDADACAACSFCRLQCLGHQVMETRTTREGCHLILTKGAPERVLPLCDTIELGVNQIVSLDGDNGTSVRKQVEAMTDRAMRVLALAYRPRPNETADSATGAVRPETGTDDLERGLTLLALVGISDPVREDVPQAVQTCKDAGINVVMVTGDHVKTAAVIAEKIGLLEDDSIILEGEQFGRMSDKEILEILPRLRVLARSRPLEKERLVELFQARGGQVVAVTGDGTNDAPALKKADVGISMGLKGTDVAKEASDIVLTDDNFGSIVRAVHWGRTLYENVQKFLQFQLTINVSALAIAFLSPLLNLIFPRLNFEPMPLTVLQLLWVNLIMDTLAALALGLEPPRPDIMKEPPKRRDESFVTRAMFQNVLVMGSYFTIVLLLLQATNFLGANLTRAGEFASVLFTTYVFFQVFNEFNARSVKPERSALTGVLKSRSFLTIVAIIIVVQIALTQFGGLVFNTAPLSLVMWIKIILLTSTALILGELYRFARRSFHKSATAGAA